MSAIIGAFVSIKAVILPLFVILFSVTNFLLSGIQ